MIWANFSLTATLEQIERTHNNEAVFTVINFASASLFAYVTFVLFHWILNCSKLNCQVNGWTTETKRMAETIAYVSNTCTTTSLLFERECWVDRISNRAYSYGSIEIFSITWLYWITKFFFSKIDTSTAHKRTKKINSNSLKHFFSPYPVHQKITLKNHTAPAKKN